MNNEYIVAKEKYAAMGIDTDAVIERLKNVPVWAFHGERDTLVLPEESEKMVAAVNSCGGNALLSLYPEICHEVWLDVYSDAEVFKWLLSHKKEHAK